jgi:hypothetical protein
MYRPKSAHRKSACASLLSALVVVVTLGVSSGHVSRAENCTASANRWWKGNIHTHSLWSDGDDFPEMIANWYRVHGYHFLVLSDHNILSEGVKWMNHEEIVAMGGKDAFEKYIQHFGDVWVETRGTKGSPNFEVRLKSLPEFRTLVEERGRFLMIQGEEISDRVGNWKLHMNATNIEEAIAPQGGRTVAEAMENNLRAVEKHASQTGREALVHVNHPNWGGYSVTAEDLASVVREQFFEVFNGHLQVAHLGDKYHPSVERLWDIANTIRLGELGAAPLYAVAADDSHQYHGQEGSHPGRGWIMVRAGELEPTTLIKSIKSGEFYASSGVTLRDVRYDRGSRVYELQIAREENEEQFTTAFIGTEVGYDKRSKPALNDEGKPIQGSRIYSSDVGKVLATVEGDSPSIRLTGEELYVRAVVTSSRMHVDPAFEDQRQQAWVQPVGWEEFLERRKAKRNGSAAE